MGGNKGLRHFSNVLKQLSPKKVEKKHTKEVPAASRR
jgi:hypothetical protein